MDVEIQRAAFADIDARIKRLGFSPQEVVKTTTWADEGNFAKLTVTLETTQDIAQVFIRARVRPKGAY